MGLGPISGVEVGGGSDGNLTAAVGTPTLDGLGAVGDGAHAEGEFVDIDAMAERAALVAALIDDLRNK
jgi:glutamate carboxypeptidase